MTLVGWLRRTVGLISVRLLLVNAVVVLVPIAGLEFARLYERQLLSSLERDMKNQAALVRAEVEEGLLRGVRLEDDVHARVLERAAKTTRTRVRILDAQGAVVGDSHADGPPEGPEPPSPSMLPDVTRSAGRDAGGPRWPEVAERTEVRAALAGDPATRTRIRDREPEVLLFLAEPIRSGGEVRGVVYVTRSTQPVLVELHRIRAGLIRVLAVALGATALVSLLLAWSISRPLSKLSRAAKRIAAGERDVAVPVGGSGEVRELTESFASMRTKLDARHRYISEFAADVAHEFKSPLTSIRGAAELLAEGAADDPAARERFLRNIELDADRLDRLVSRLLELSRIESSTDVAVPVDFSETVARAARRCCLPTHPVEVRYEASTRLLVVRETDVETALCNLIDNAVHVSPEGVGVDVVVEDRGQDVVVTVTDRGPGIPEAVQRRMFDRFFTTDGERSGTGLGLAIVKSVAEAHGGAVEFETTRGEGTSFRLVLPRRPPRVVDNRVE